jgi:hypothetical protein
MLRAEAVKAMGGYRLAGSGEDLDFCLRMCDVGLAANLPDVLLGYRLHMGSASVTRLADMRRGYAYAIECAKRRSIGLSEPEMGAFSVQWRQRGWWPRTMDRLEDAGTVRYRRAVIDLALGRGVRGCWGLALAAACRPSAVAYRLLGRLA